MRTKKEILDNDGNIRKGCKIIKKGEVYERKNFSVKDSRFKHEAFLDEAKVFYTDLINQMVLDDKDRLSIFDKNGPYLATKKVGKNNPKAEEIKAIKPGGSIEKMTEELQSLLVRKAYLEGLLGQYTDPSAEGAFYADKLVHMTVPKTLEEIQGEQDSGIDTGQVKDTEGGTEKLKTAMKTIIKSSAFDRAMKVEAELNRLHGRIIKQIDSIKSYEMEERRLSLEERKYQLAKQKLTGEIIIDDETEEIIDDLMEDD